MRIFLNFILLLVIALLPTLIATSCQGEDDIEAIFNGKTWYITGGCINGTNISGNDLRSLYAIENSYFITFSSATFGGVLVAGSNIGGTWKANGKDHSIYLNFQQAENVAMSALSNNIYNVLKNAQHYSGDMNVLKIMQDNYNYIRLSARKTTNGFQSRNDIEAIFNGKTWYITGGCINGTNISGDDLRALYTNENSYFITFSDATFGGVLVAGSIIDGTWKANGKDHSICLNFQQADNVNLAALSNNIYNVLKNAQHYSGEVTVLKIMQDNDNFIRLSSGKSTNGFQSEDDIEAIFNGKTWYITGGCIDGTNISGNDLKSLYTNDNSYFITFASATFGGVLVAGSNIGGTWKANGKDHSIYLNFQQAENVTMSALSNNIYNVLKNAQHYSGEVTVLKITQDNDNFICLSTRKSTNGF